MSSVVIQVENLSKQYRLGEVSTGTISHDLNRWWCRLRGKEDPYLQVTQTNVREQKGTTEDAEYTEKPKRRGSLRSFLRHSAHSAVTESDYVWALRDINFEVERGEVLGIIGANGAGKSTLLKILSRITAPTTGEVRIKGRVASLLEVGTGFHQELTGRENIYLNGAILGMTKPEIASKLDEIVDFSGCARYLDTPVKRYSSGMMVRLGFAVAAHLEPEILIVDEVLAVGDAEFQKKCIGKMQDVSGHGRTVLFVSHNMASVQMLCSHAILLEKGAVTKVDDTDSVIDHYLSQTGQETLHLKASLPSNKIAYISEIQFVNRDSLQSLRGISTATPIGVVVRLVIVERVTNLRISLAVKDSYGQLLFSSRPNEDAGLSISDEPGEQVFLMHLPDSLLLPKRYRISACLWTPDRGELNRSDELTFHVIDDSRSFTNAPTMQRRNGLLAVRCKWEPLN